MTHESNPRDRRPESAPEDTSGSEGTRPDDGSTAARLEVARAVERARREGKRVAVLFTADWCPDARALDAAMAHEVVSAIVEPAFVCTRFDVGQRDRHLGLMFDYGLDVHRGIPALAVLDADGELVAALRDGELARARSLPLVAIAEIFHRFESADSQRS